MSEAFRKRLPQQLPSALMPTLTSANPSYSRHNVSDDTKKPFKSILFGGYSALTTVTTISIAVSALQILVLLMLHSYCTKSDQGKEKNPDTRLALVIPFTAKDASQVEDRLVQDWKVHPPCDIGTKTVKRSVDLILYYDGYIDDAREGRARRLMVPRLRDIAQREWGGVCFGKVRVMEAGLVGSDTAYPIGPSNMFFKAIETLAAPSSPTSQDISSSTQPLKSQSRRPGASHHHRVWPHYDAMYYMEPDNRPCRSLWLERLLLEASVGTINPYWIRGSGMRDGINTSSTYTFSDHINGNALYNLADSRFTHNFLLARVRAAMREDSEAFLGSYDIAMELVRRNRTWVSWSEFMAMSPFWQYTPTLQNWYRTPVNASELCAREQATFLVHGRAVYM